MMVLVHLGQQFSNVGDSVAKDQEFINPRSAREGEGDTLDHIVHIMFDLELIDVPQLISHITDRLVGQLQCLAQARN